MNCFSVEQFDVMASILKNIVESSFKDEQKRQEFRENNDYDEEVEPAFQKHVGACTCI